MTAIIIGGAGFVGHYLIKELTQKAGIDVFVTKLESERIKNENCTVVNLDITSFDSTLEVIDKIKPDFIYHLAAQSSVALSWKMPQKTYEINVIGTINILQALKQLKSEARMLFIGSGEQYGIFSPERLPLKEDCPLCPQNIYAETKASAERLCLLYNKAYGLDIICVRAFNHIGAMQSDIFVAADFAHQVARIEKGRQEPVIKTGNLSAVRDFTDVRDVVKAYILIMEKGYKGEVYNVGGSSVMPVSILLDTLIRHSDVKIKRETDEKKLRPVDIPEIYCDITKLKSHTGYKVKYPIEETLLWVLDYWRKRVEEE